MAAAQTKGHEEDKHTEMQEKNKKIKEKRKTKSRKQGTKASKQENRTQGVYWSIATNLPVSATSRDGDLVTPSAIFFLFSSASVSSVTAAAVEPPPPRTNQRKPNKTVWTRGL